MRYRKLSDQGDYTFGQGRLDFYANSPQTVGQAIKTRLLLMTKEWFLDVTSGTDYSGKVLGTHTASTRDLEIKSRILKTPGVLELLAYASQVVDRRFSVQARVLTIYGPTAVEVTFP